MSNTYSHSIIGASGYVLFTGSESQCVDYDKDHGKGFNWVIVPLAHPFESPHAVGTDWRFGGDRVHFNPGYDSHKPYVCYRNGDCIIHKATLREAMKHLRPYTSESKWVMTP